MLKKTDYIHLGRYKSPLIYHWLLEKWANNEAARQYGLPELDGRLLLLDGHIFVYRNDWEKIKQITEKAVKQGDKKLFTAVFKLMNRETARMLRAAQRLYQDKELKPELFQGYFQAMNQMEYPWFFVLPMSEALEQTVQKELSKAGLEKECLQLFFTSSKPTPLLLQGQEITAIKKELTKKRLLAEINNLSAAEALDFLKKHDSGLFQKILEHIKTYKWVGMMHMWGVPFSKTKFFEQLKSTNAEPSPEIEEPKLPKELQWLRKQTSELAYWRNYVAETCGMASYLALNKLKKAFKEIGVSCSLGGWLSPPEFLKGLEHGKIPSQQTLKERKKAFGLLLKTGQIAILTGNELSQTTKRMLGNVPEQTEIIGVVANPGKAKGQAKIISSPQDINKIEKGDIMVAAETTPDFVPAIHRAAAIVTDMGGITSHAAIISREVGLPCVVGTKIATRVLKDGDIIEIDGNTGTVKILKKG